MRKNEMLSDISEWGLASVKLLKKIRFESWPDIKLV